MQRFSPEAADSESICSGRTSSKKRGPPFLILISAGTPTALQSVELQCGTQTLAGIEDRLRLNANRHPTSLQAEARSWVGLLQRLPVRLARKRISFRALPPCTNFNQDTQARRSATAEGHLRMYNCCQAPQNDIRHCVGEQPAEKGGQCRAHLTNNCALGEVEDLIGCQVLGNSA